MICFSVWLVLFVCRVVRYRWLVLVKVMVWFMVFCECILLIMIMFGVWCRVFFSVILKELVFSFILCWVMMQFWCWWMYLIGFSMEMMCLVEFLLWQLIIVVSEVDLLVLVVLMKIIRLCLVSVSFLRIFGSFSFFRVGMLVLIWCNIMFIRLCWQKVLIWKWLMLWVLMVKLYLWFLVKLWCCCLFIMFSMVLWVCFGDSGVLVIGIIWLLIFIDGGMLVVMNRLELFFFIIRCSSFLNFMMFLFIQGCVVMVSWMWMSGCWMCLLVRIGRNVFMVLFFCF